MIPEQESIMAGELRRQEQEAERSHLSCTQEAESGHKLWLGYKTLKAHPQ